MTGENGSRAVLERGLAEAFAQLPEPLRAVAIDKLVALLRHVTDAERMRCVKLCRARAHMWRTTRMARDESHAAAVVEARARANEAEFLADALETPPEVDEVPNA
ncbi:MAG TPA: hypothetical protein VJR89_23460 [Polyangiales bacterium]|nr:hypothetical protein [Polyangiales bacterium]